LASSSTTAVPWSTTIKSPAIEVTSNIGIFTADRDK
jgi:hypothetical protein